MRVLASAADYHVHSTFSLDSDTPLAMMCARAVALGLPEIAFTEHADFHPADEGRGYFDPDAYFAELERCRARFGGQLTIRAGVELSEPHRHPAEAAALIDQYPFDIVLGSLHWVGDELALLPEYFAGRDADAAYDAYFMELAELARHGGFDVLSHLDVPKRAGFDAHSAYDATRYVAQIERVLRCLIAAGGGLEINTCTLRRAVGETAPGLAVLRRYRELGGTRLTFGSDAHAPDALGHGFEVAAELARAAGFTQWTRFERRRARRVPLA